jgi:hypothetical protein
MLSMVGSREQRLKLAVRDCVSAGMQSGTLASLSASLAAPVASAMSADSMSASAAAAAGRSSTVDVGTGMGTGTVGMGNAAFSNIDAQAMVATLRDSIELETALRDDIEMIATETVQLASLLAILRPPPVQLPHPVVPVPMSVAMPVSESPSTSMRSIPGDGAGTAGAFERGIWLAGHLCAPWSAVPGLRVQVPSVLHCASCVCV